MYLSIIPTPYFSTLRNNKVEREREREREREKKTRARFAINFIREKVEFAAKLFQRCLVRVYGIYDNVKHTSLVMQSNRTLCSRINKRILYQ